MKLNLFILSIAAVLVAQGVIATETCDETCTEECTCPERKTCSETEIDCGPSAETPEGHCDPDRVCVASNCQCKILANHIDIIQFKPKLYNSP